MERTHPVNPTLKAIVLITMVFLSFGKSSGQQKVWKQYTTNDGLPGNTVYDIIQDRTGHIWIATNHGICRFTGYEFLSPVEPDSPSGPEAFVPTEDSQGRIWFARLDATLSIVENDTIRSWKHNDKIQKHSEKNRIVHQLGIHRDGTIWLALVGKGFLVIDTTGQAQFLRVSDNSNFCYTEIGDRMIYASQSPVEYHPTQFPLHFTHDLIFINDTIPELIFQKHFDKPRDSFVRGAWPISGGVLYDHGRQASFISNRTVQWSVSTEILAERMAETADGEILIASPHGELTGLFHFASVQDFRDGKFLHHLPGLYVSAILVDHDGGWWASTLSQGIFYCKNPGVDVFNSLSGLSSDDIHRVATDCENFIFTGHRPTGVGKIDMHNRNCTNLGLFKSAAKEIVALEYDSVRGFLWSGPMLTFRPVHGADEWSDPLWHNVNSNRFSVIPSKTIHFNDHDQLIYASSHSGFYILNPASRGFSLHGTGDTTLTHDRTFDIATDPFGNIWVSTTDGLRQWKEGHYHDPDFNHPALSHHPRKFVFSEDGTMIIGLARGGVLIKDTQDHFTHLTTNDGLSSDFINTLRSAHDTLILVCTNTGLNCITKTQQQWKIHTISIKDGLPSNQVNDATICNDEIWVATEKGLVNMKYAPLSDDMPPPVIQAWRVNRHVIPHASDIDLAHDLNNISIRFYALHYRSAGEILYRYRLHPVDPGFIESTSREVNFFQLASGEYIFEVQAQNINGQWSLSTLKPFVIRPAWWQTWWFRGAIILVLLAGLWYFYLRRLHENQKALAVQNKMRDLESAALRAQMNPHFIFNCLVSIQQFITENDADSASAYLAKFAKLVRLALHSSVDGRHSLREEIEMLENYLALEQLRFKGGFIYQMHVSPEINMDEVALPPLLIQPFVENAIVHGMKNKKGDGQIEISFSKHAQNLIVMVADNGPGIVSANQVATETGHKSVGMILTQRRLDILAGYTGDNVLGHENLTDDHGVVIGSKVRVEIPVE